MSSKFHVYHGLKKKFGPLQYYCYPMVQRDRMSNPALHSWLKNCSVYLQAAKVEKHGVTWTWRKFPSFCWRFGTVEHKAHLCLLGNGKCLCCSWLLPKCLSRGLFSNQWLPQTLLLSGKRFPAPLLKAPALHPSPWFLSLSLSPLLGCPFISLCHHPWQL